ncbi:hypothetical protein JKF63_05568 [Porcisia hertigi]|uniref:Uncharacterized protein n=1 Tax=Porcisia hertigi TaxID=2761500 RepID=A0A836I1Y1_9TRYP|nr:hypothetical protein JKF63_05568 [Porcisia hertigi]
MPPSPSPPLPNFPLPHTHMHATLDFSCSQICPPLPLLTGCMFTLGNVSGAAGGGAPPPFGAPGRGDGAQGVPSNTTFHAAGGAALTSAEGDNARLFHRSFNTPSENSSQFGGGAQAAPLPVFGGAAPMDLSDHSSRIPSHSGNANMSASRHGMRPSHESILPFSAVPVFGTGMPPPSYSSGASTMVAPSVATIPSPAAPVFVTPIFASAPPPPPPPASGGGQQSSGGNNNNNNQKSKSTKDGGNSRLDLPRPRSLQQRSQESRPWPNSAPNALLTSALPTQFLAGGSGGAESGPRPSPTFPDAASTVSSSQNSANANALVTPAPVRPFAATQGSPGTSDAGGSVFGSVFAALGTAGNTGKGASSPQSPPPPISSVFASSFPPAKPANAAVKDSALTSNATAPATEPASLIPVAAPPPSVFGASAFGKAPAPAAGSLRAATTPAMPFSSPPAGITKAPATGANTRGSAFGQLDSQFGTPSPTPPAPASVFSAFGAGSPVVPEPTPPSASLLGQHRAPLGGSKMPTNLRATPFAPSQLPASVAPAPAAVASAFGAAASQSSPRSHSGSGSGGSVFAAKAAASAATSALTSASSLGASASAGKVFSPVPQAPKEADISAGSGSGSGDGAPAGRRRRGRSPTSSDIPQGGGSGPRGEAPVPRHRERPHRPSRLPRQNAPSALLRLDRVPIPPLPADEKTFCIAARLCKSFLLQLASAAALGSPGSGASSSKEEDVAKTLEQAYFGVVGIEGVYGDFGRTAGEMLALWNGQVKPVVSGRATHGSDSGASTVPGEMWIALFALGTYLNTIMSTLQSRKTGRHVASSTASASMADLASYKAGLRAHPTEALTDACHYANELSELLQAIFQRTSEADAPPYSVIPVVLRRVRSVFDEATARGVAMVQSNLNAVTSKLFAVLNRRVKTSAMQPLGEPGEAPRWLLAYDSKVKESLLHSFAYLVIEMIAADAPTNDDVELFISAFHECFPSALAERCMLYYRRACALLRQPLCMSLAEEAAALLAKATVVYPPGAPSHNKRVLLVKLLAAELALGRLPPDNDWLALDVPQLVDVVNALKTSRLDLLDMALRMHGPFFVEIGVHNALCLARQRLALLMVVKFYLTHGRESRLCVSEMVRYHRLPYSAADAGIVWLLPLLVEKQINGVLDHDYLILSAKSPFDDYPREALAEAAASA